MAMTTAERRQKQLERAKAAQKRAKDKALAKLNDPEEQQKRRDKQRAAAQRARDRAKEKASAPKATRRKLPQSKGLKGRSPSAEERRIMDAFGALPCMACAQQGRYSPVVSLHHIDGRTKPLAHARVLPLCAPHHDTPAEKDAIQVYPDLVPIHARGTLGGKAQWRAHNGHELELLAQCYARAGIAEPDSLFSGSYHSERCE